MIFPHRRQQKGDRLLFPAFSGAPPIAISQQKGDRLLFPARTAQSAFSPAAPIPVNHREALRSLMIEVDEKAVVHPKAVLEEGVEIGPYSVVGENVRVGPGTRIGPYVLLDGWTTIGSNCQIFAGAVIGTVPQDLKFKGARSFASIGNNNVIREYATINRATDEEGTTLIGDNNLLMAYVHVAHNCKIGNNVIMANVATLAGHVTLEDKAVLGGLSAVHQFVKIGTVSIVGGCSKVVKDVPPYIKADGHPLLQHRCPVPPGPSRVDI